MNVRSKVFFSLLVIAPLVGACASYESTAAVIPPKSNRRIAREYDAHLYKIRNLIERMYGKLKQFRRVATRYDKLASSFMSFVLVAAIAIWLK